jgi:hypothetical protein
MDNQAKRRSSGNAMALPATKGDEKRNHSEPRMSGVVKKTREPEAPL